MKLIATSFLIFFCLSSVAVANDQETANRLYVSAIKKWNDANTLSSDQNRRLARLEEVQANLDRLIDDHGGSDLAVELIIGKKVGPLSLAIAAAALRDARFQVDLQGCEKDPYSEIWQTCLFTLAIEAAVGIEPDTETGFLMRDYSLSDISRAQAAAGLFSQALRTARRIRSPEVRNDISGPMAQIVEAQAKFGLIEEALATARAIPSDETRSYALRRVTAVQVDAGTMEKAFETALSIGHDYHRVHAMIKVGIAPEAVKIARQVEDEKDRANILHDVAVWLADERLLEESLEVARVIEGWFDRSWTLKRIAITHAKAARFDQALVIVDGIEMDNIRSMALREVAVAQANLGFFTQALATAGGIGFGGPRDQVLIEIALSQAETGLFTDALETASLFEDQSATAFVLGALGALQADSEIFAKAVDKTHAIIDPEIRALTFLALGVMQVNREMFRHDSHKNLFSAAADADPMFIEKAFDAARGIDDASDRAAALFQIALAQPNAGRIRQALQWVYGVEDKTDRALAMAKVLRVLQGNRFWN